MSDELFFVHVPHRISRTQFARVLARGQSPALAEIDAIYDHLTLMQIDAGVALAFFLHESSLGRKGWAVKTINWGNIRRGRGRQLRHEGGWAWYETWLASLQDWCDLIAQFYVARGLDSVEKAIPVYAPSSDNNVPASYIRAVRQAVAAWQREDAELAAETPPLPAWVAWGPRFPLSIPERAYGIPQRWFIDDGRLGQATSNEVYINTETAIRSFEKGWIIYDVRSSKTHLVRRSS